LNAHNILYAWDRSVWIVDFDRARRMLPARRWQQLNLARLRRSLAKVARGRAQPIEQGWSTLVAAHERALDEHNVDSSPRVASGAAR
jgi:hypothetical protein